MTMLGYLRVSKADARQSLDQQRDALLAVGVKARHLYGDTASGNKNDRPGLEACLKALRPGDVLVVGTLGRLGRNLRHLVNTVLDLNRRRIGLKVLATESGPMETSSAAGKRLLHVFTALAKFEQELIVERTKVGMAAPRILGRSLGRKCKMTADKVRLASAVMSKPGTNVGKLCRKLGISRQTLYRHVGPDGSVRPDGAKFLESRAELLAHKSVSRKEQLVSDRKVSV
jgi:DNA invertase Pin-like site-specific DNA recombinase